MVFKLFRGTAKKTVPEDKLPQLHSFVDVTVGGRAARSVSIEELAPPDHITVGDVIGRKGERGVFVYQTPLGKFRFAAAVSEVRDGMTVFEIPDRIETLGGGAQKRSSVRIDTLLGGQWRMAPGGKGVGEFMKGSIRDISRGGCALIMDRQCKVGQTLEVKMNLSSNAPPISVLGEVMRVEQVPTSGKFSHGLRFHGITPTEDHAILDYINRRTAELRSRGLA
jgi:hypothetical protein